MATKIILNRFCNLLIVQKEVKPHDESNENANVAGKKEKKHILGKKKKILE